MLSESMVTICIPVYNAEKFIDQTLDSVYSQTYKNIEVIIINDCSTDNSVTIIQNWLLHKAENFTFINNEKNIGLLKCCNAFLPIIKTKYFQILGHDDIIYPNKISEQVKALNQLEDSAAMVYSNMNVIDILGNKVSNSFFERAEYLGKPPSGNIYNELIKGNFICASSVLCKTSLVKAQGGYNENLFFEDWPMWIKLSAYYKIVYLDTVLGAYRVTNNSMIHAEGNTKVVASNTFSMYNDLIKSNYPNSTYLKLMLKKQYLRIALAARFDFKVLVYYFMSIFKIKSPI
jgi:glycosyltransferase involved in cell wall biosynthesis